MTDEKSKDEQIHFPPEVAASLKSYVYLLLDPRFEPAQVFYVGKGKGDRIYAHVRAAEAADMKEHLDEDDLNDQGVNLKLKTIQDIKDAGKSIQHRFLRHGLTDDEALLVESSAIDLINHFQLGGGKLTNLQSGSGSHQFGLMTDIDLKKRYGSEAFEPAHNLLLIKIQNSLRTNSKTEEEETAVAESVRGTWKLSAARANKCDYVLAIDQGFCRGVYLSKGWKKASNGTGADKSVRKEFKPEQAPKEIQDLYLHKRVPATLAWKRGAMSPIRYVSPSFQEPED